MFILHTRLVFIYDVKKCVLRILPSETRLMVYRPLRVLVLIIMLSTVTVIVAVNMLSKSKNVVKIHLTGATLCKKMR